MSEDIRVDIYIEQDPEHYVSSSEVSITARCKPSNQWKLDLLVDMIKSFEGWEFKEMEVTDDN